MSKPISKQRKRNQLLAKVLVAGVATLIALGAGELSLRVAPTPAQYMSMRNVVQQQCTRPHPECQYVNRENYRGTFNNPEFHTRVQINSHMLRDREFPYEKPAGVKRSLVLGDSFAFGWGVEAEETASKVIERALPGTEVLNAGCSGWGSLQELAFLQVEGIRYHPDLVLLFYGENDSIDNFTHYEFRHGRLMYAGTEQGLRADTERFLLKHSAIWNLVAPMLPTRGAAAAPAKPATPPPYWKTLADSILEMQQVCRKAGARLAVVYTPSKGPDRLPVQGGTYKEMRSLCVSHDIEFIDPIPALRQAAASHPVYFDLDDHWNRDGHAAVGAAVAEVLRTGHLLAGPAAAPAGR
jgi:hypothetical protein